LTVLRGYIIAGCPDMKLPQWGSYENWSALIRDAVVWASMPDPWQGREALRNKHGDDQIAAMSGLMRLWPTIDTEGTGLTCADVVKRIDALPDPNELAEVLLILAGGKHDSGLTVKPDKRASTLGYRFRHYADRIIGGRRLRTLPGSSSGVKKWMVETVDATTSKPAGTSGDGGHSGDAANCTHAREEKTQSSLNG